MAKQSTEKIRFWGIVQGVGFRPFVAKVAERMAMKGTVANIGGLVEVVVTDEKRRIDEFVAAIEKEKPGPAEIVHIRREEIEETPFDSFTILKSGEGEREVAMIPADIAICPDCLREMNDDEDRRYKHPFISCYACGPRYTIVDRFPYDRENTSMIDFPMCPTCEAEYTDVADRRYHAQTVSCHDCGPQMLSWLADEIDTDRTPLEMAASLLREGRVIALKGVGGYNLIANPLDMDAVRDLREIKGREEKPFAVMFRTVDEIKEYCLVNEVEESLLNSSARPILLLEGKTREEMEEAHPANYTEFLKNRHVGCFLPSMGAQYILLDLMKGPLIVTSANVSGMPIIKDDEEMMAFAKEHPKIAGVFYNERKIRVRVDDSVARVVDGQPQIIRRSKGYAPVPMYVENCDEEILAVGGQLKNSFAISKDGFVYMSQYFGDMDSLDNQRLFEENVERMCRLFRIEPKKVVCDLHPGYFTTAFAEKYAEEHDIPLVRVQHHHAHVASVMAEHDLTGPVIGVSFDGTGYGTDGTIWGGEFLLCEGGRFQRVAHLKDIDMIGGDSSMKDGWKSALSYLYARDGGELDYMSDEEVVFYLKDIARYARENGTLEHRETELTEKILESGINVIRSSSMGRLFDGVAAMLGICDYNSYEGQCAILLEDKAAESLRDPGMDEAADLAMDFHHMVVNTIARKCLQIRKETGCDKVVLTGGVFQNHILMAEALRILREKNFTVYYNISVSPNDGGIALGQAYLAGFEETGEADLMAEMTSAEEDLPEDTPEETTEETKKEETAEA